MAHIYIPMEAKVPSRAITSITLHTTCKLVISFQDRSSIFRVYPSNVLFATLQYHCRILICTTGHDNLLMKFLFPFFVHQIITKEEANRRRMTILECEMNLPLPELRGSSELLEDIFIRKVSQLRFHVLYINAS